MAYEVKRSSTTFEPIEVEDNSLDQTTSLDLVGRDRINYGEVIATTQVHLLENFASKQADGTDINSGPRLPAVGQLWYDTTLAMITDGEGGESIDPLVPGQLRVNITDKVGLSGNGDWRVLAGSNMPGDEAGSLGTAEKPWNTIYASRLDPGTGAPIDGTFGSITASSIGTAETPVDDLYLNNLHGGGTIEGAWTLVGDSTLQATYADIAERFAADAKYPEGTLVRIGGDEEITATSKAYDKEAFGIVSTKPAFMLNAGAGNNDTHPFVALAGRVPALVEGKVKKGQRIVSSDIPGVGIAVNISDRKLNQFNIIGRALESKDTEEIGQVLVVVGAK